MSNMLEMNRFLSNEKSSTRKLRLFIVTFSVAFCTAFASSFDPTEVAATPAFQNAKKKKPPTQDPPAVTSGDTLLKLEEMLKRIPTRKQLLEKKFDWVVKGNDDVIVCEPVKMRPDTLTRIPAKLEELGKITPTPDDYAERRDEIANIPIIPIEEDESIEYLIHYTKVKKIYYHEDLLLLRIEIMQNQGNLPDAWQLLFDLKRRVPNWPRVDEVFNRHTLFESRKYNREGKYSTALTFLEDLFQRNKSFAGLSAELGISCEALISDAVNRREYREARYHLERLYVMLPNHTVSKKWSKTLSDFAEASMIKALAAFDRKQYSQAVNLIEEAAYIWPRHARVKIEYTRIKNRYQTLRAGVVNFPNRRTTFPFATIADNREKHLTQSSIFQAERIDGFIHYNTPFFEKWIPSDLGRRLVFKVNRNHPYWKSTANLSANNIANTLKARIDPAHAEYDERLESYLQSISVFSPEEFRLIFKRNPPRLESLMNFPIIDPLIASAESNVSQETKADLPLQKNLLSRRFQPAAKERWSANEMVFTRFRPEPDGVRQYHVGEVYERQYPSYDKARQAFIRGEVDFLPHIRSWEVPGFQDKDEFEVVQYALPLNHTLQFNPKSFLMKYREMRRALRFGIDRDAILRNSILLETGKRTARGRLVSAPYSSKSYAYNSSILQPEYNPIQAMGLAIVSKSRYLTNQKDVEDKEPMPGIRMIVDPDPIAQKAARAIVQSWKKSKIEVTIVPFNEASPDEWDIVYRVSKMVDPVVDLWPYLTMQNRARVEILGSVPDWIRQKLIRVEYARSWNDAVKKLHEIHDLLSRAAYTIPLWEVDDYLVIRKGILGIKKNPLFTYQGIEAWRVPATLSD